MWACSADSPAPHPAHPTTAPTITQLEVAITIDDLPLHGPSFVGVDRVAIADKMLAAFARHHLPPVYGFVNGKKVGDDPASEAVLRHWLAAGNPLGNHSYSHPSLNKTALADYLADIERGEAILRELEPSEARWRWFRYPFLMEGDTLEKRSGVRAFLSAHHYRTAEVSVDADDWAFNPPFARCSDRGDRAELARLHEQFVSVHVAELSAVRALGKALVGREIAHVVLLHIGAADADAMDDLLTAYEREGAHFVPLERAMDDAFYAIDPAVPFRFGAAFPYVVAKARGVKAPAPAYATDLEDQLERVCAKPQ
jgi:peptidoglycan/xylan/chitin deacetylase (PgdA/CDA1 family)